MSEDLVAETQASATPEPAPADPAAALTPSRNSSYDLARREKLAAWLADADDEPEAEETVEEEAATSDEGEEDSSPQDAEAQAGEPAALATPDEEGAADGEEAGTATVDAAPTQKEAAAKTSGPRKEERSREPKRYTAKVGDEEWEAPEGLVLRYKADGEERERTLDEVVRYAQLGENYDRRSRELASRQRELEARFAQEREQLHQQYATALNQLLETARRFAEDAEFREQFLEEYERLQSNPEELELRAKAQRAEQYERQLEELRKQQLANWQRQMWQNVDAIIAENAETYPYADAKRVRERWYQAYLRDPSTAASEPFLVNLMREEHEAIARIVEDERQRVEQELTSKYQREIQQAKAEAVVQRTNQTTDQALARERVARKVPNATPAPVPKAGARIKTYQDASRALREWAESP